MRVNSDLGLSKLGGRNSCEILVEIKLCLRNSPVPQISASFAEFRIFSAIFCGSPHNKCGVEKMRRKCGQNKEIILRECGEFGLSHLHEVYNAEKWDLENVKRGKNAEIWT